MKKDRCGGLFLRGRGYSRLPARIVSSFAQRAAVPSLLQRGMHILRWQEPSLHLTCPPRMRLGGERLYTLLRPTACQGGEGHAVVRGDCRRHAGSRQPSADSGQPRPPPPSFRAKPRNLPPATCFNGLTVKHITFLRPLATTPWWDYGCLAMGQCLYRKA